MGYDWNDIKTEYITTDTSYRKLCEKYGCSTTALYSRAKKEKWVELKEQHNSNIVTKSVKKAEESAIDYKSTLYDLAYSVAQQLATFTNGKSIEELIAIGVKPRDITGAIKDLEDALHIKSKVDLREQEARIRNLEKQAEADDTSTEVTIKFEGNTSEWAK